MKARFSELPQEVVIINDGNIVYCQIALNAVEVVVEDPESGTTRREWEVDFNDFSCSRFDIDINDVRENPRGYLDYHPGAVTENETRLRDIETALAELGEIIGEM